MATPTNLPAAVSVGDLATAAYANDIRGAFRVLQVVYESFNTDTPNPTSTYADTGLAATITPQATSSKILVLASIPCLKESANANNANNFRLFRGATQIRETTFINFTATALQMRTVFSDIFLDSPASITAVTYKYQFANAHNGNGVSVFPAAAPGQLTLMEISA